MLKIIIQVISFVTISMMHLSSYAQCDDVYIAGLMDGHTMSATPKFVLICANTDILDLSIYSVGSANNGGGTTSPGEYTFPSDALAAGDCVTLATEVPMFLEYFGCNPTYTNGSVVNVNGDDAIELFCNGTLIDVYGDVDTDGTGEPWEYVDGWAVRLASNTSPNPNFNVSEWIVAPMQTPMMHHFNDNGNQEVSCPDCNITDVVSGTQSGCDPVTNTYTQDIIVTYSGGPGTGNLVVNGQLFTLEPSPQTVTLSGLDSDGLGVDVSVSFSDLPGCTASLTDLFTAPDNCFVPVLTCSISNLSVENISCSDAGLSVDICFDHENPISSEIAITIAGTYVGNFNYPTNSGDCVSVNSMIFTSGMTDITIRDAASTDRIYISEFHYDNASNDVGEFIEVTGPVGTDFTGYSLSLYNGTNNSEYDNIDLTGIIPGTAGACGVISFDTPGLQNGPDAIALVDDLGVVVQFISYEGVLTAIGGPADGMTSVDVIVEESTTAAVTSSLSLIGGVWNVTDPNSRGAINTGATCTAPCEQSVTFASPSCCSPFVVDASAFCSDGNSPFLEEQYYIAVESIEGGHNSGSYNVSIQGLTQTYSGARLVFGPFAHSGVGNANQSLTVLETSSLCQETIDITETICTDINGSGSADNDLAYCSCDANSSTDNPGVIISQSVPGSYMSGGTSDKTQVYILSESNTGIIKIVDINNTGLFSNLGGEEYYVYAINYDDNNSDDLQNLLTIGGTLDIEEVQTQSAPYDDECYSICGPASYLLDCFPTSGSLSCNDHLNISVGSTCEVELEPSIFLQGAIGNLDNYQIVITDDQNNIIDYNSVTIANSDDIRNYLDQNLTFTITDICSDNTCWGLVTFEDKTPPVITCDCPVGGEDTDGDGIGDAYAGDCIFNCYEISLIEGDVNNALPSDIEDFVNNDIDDNCYDYTVDDVTFEDDLTDLGPCAGSKLRRTWTVKFEDINRPGTQNTVSCTREYLFSPIDLSTIDTAQVTSPEDDVVYWPVYQTEIDCHLGTDPSSIGRNLGLEFAYPHIYIDGEPFVIEDNLCNLSVNYEDIMLDGCSPTCNGNRKVLRKWTILDWCTSNVYRYTQIVKSVDDLEPIVNIGIDSIAAVVSGNSCTANIELAAPLVSADFCEGALDYYIENNTNEYTISGNSTDGYMLNGVPTGEHVVYYAAADCCGNIGRDSLIVTVTDNNRPACIAIERLVVALNNSGTTGPDDILARVSAHSVDNGSFDFCSEVTLDLRRLTDNCDSDNSFFGPLISFCCEDMNVDGWGEVEVELRVTDAGGNACLVRSMVILQDKSVDDITCPDGMIIDCMDDISDLSITGVPSVSGICGAVTLDFNATEVVDGTIPFSKPNNASPLVDIDDDGDNDVVPPYDETCGYGALLRTFRDGNSVICSQYFVVFPADPFDPNSIVWPADATVDCASFDPGVPTFSEVTCGNIAIGIESDTFRTVDHACYKVAHTHSIVDWCTYTISDGQQGIYTHTQYITVVDDSAPDIIAEDNLVYEITENCFIPSLSLIVVATDNDNCPDEKLDWLIELDYDIDGSIQERFVHNTFSGDTLFIPLQTTSVGDYAITYTVTDDCGNVGKRTIRYTIVDKKSPTPYCINVSTAIMDNGEVEIWAIDLNLGSTDNCTNVEDLRYSFSNIEPPNSDVFYNPENGNIASEVDYYNGEADSYDSKLRSSGRVISADDIDENGRVTLSVYVWDEDGNFDLCTVTVSVSDNNTSNVAAVSGQFYTEMGDRVQSVNTNITNSSSGLVENAMSNKKGQYAFEGITAYTEYDITADKNDDYLNGISTLDILQMQKHILNQELLDSPYKMIAADITNDRNITALDLIELRKLILGINDSFTHNGSWKFIEESQILDINNPWNYEEEIHIDNLVSDREDQDFIAIKIGDVNNTVIPNVVQKATELRKSERVELRYENRYVEVGDNITLSLYTDRTDIYGYQISLSTVGMDIISCNGRDIAEGNYNILTDNRLAISHNSGYPVDNDDAIISLDLLANEGGWLSDKIQVISDVMRSEAYVSTDFDFANFILLPYDESTFELYQNEPNPFTDYTTITFELPEDNDVRLSLYDVKGQLVKEITRYYTKGTNTIRLSKEDIGIAGLIYYNLESGTQFATRRMILIE